MKKMLSIFVGLIISASSFGQIAYLHYRNVPAEHEEKFVELETKYWSKVAKAAIDKGQMSGWSLWRKVGVTTVEAPNYVFVNTYEKMEQVDAENIWGENIEAAGVPASAVETMSLSTLTFDYYCQLEESIEGDYKYALVNYAKPTDVGAFIEENRTLWKPIHEKNIKKGDLGMTSWGMMSVIYPQGKLDRFSVLTWDGFNKLSDVMNFMRYLNPDEAQDGPFQEAVEKTKLGEILPNGFEYRIIYERVMSISAD